MSVTRTHRIRLVVALDAVSESHVELFEFEHRVDLFIRSYVLERRIPAVEIVHLADLEHGRSGHAAAVIHLFFHYKHAVRIERYRISSGRAVPYRVYHGVRGHVHRGLVPALERVIKRLVGKSDGIGRRKLRATARWNVSATVKRFAVVKIHGEISDVVVVYSVDDSVLGHETIIVVPADEHVVDILRRRFIEFPVVVCRSCSIFSVSDRLRLALSVTVHKGDGIFRILARYRRVDFEIGSYIREILIPAREFADSAL